MRSKNTAHYSTIISYVNAYYDDVGRSPSTREIETGTGISRPTVQRYLREMCEPYGTKIILEQDGLITCEW